MANNTKLNPGTGGDDIATEDISAVKHQLVKLEFGVDGVATKVSSSDPLPVYTVSSLPAGSAVIGAVTQSGTWNIGTVTTVTAVTSITNSVAVTGTFWQATQPVSLASVPSHAVTNAGTFAVQVDGAALTSLQLLDDAISGSEMQVDVVAALPTGTNSIGAVTNTALTKFAAGEYETVAASQTAQVLGATGGTGDYIAGVLVIPATTSPGNVILLDNATSITIFTGGASSVSNLVPFFIPLGMISVSGAFKITTGANVSCIGIGDFT